VHEVAVLTSYSLGFSDDSVSTTTGRPSAWTIRYSPPEVLDFEPRNRASDIFSLGCVLIEVISGLYGHSLSEVKDHWKKEGNGQFSFARNPDAKLTWLSSLPEHPNTRRLKVVVEFLPSMLDAQRSQRPSAQQVVDRLRNLSLLLPDDPQHISTCCGPSLLSIGALGPQHAGETRLPKTRDPEFWPQLIKYFKAAEEADMSYVVLDRSYNLVASKHKCYTDLWDLTGTRNHHPRNYDNFVAIQNACDMLYMNSSKTRPQVHTAQDVTFGGAYREDFLPQILRLHSTWHTIFTAVKIFIHMPDFRSRFPSGLSPEFHPRTVQISMVGLGHPSYLSAVFYVLAFNTSDRGYEPSRLGAPYVDFTTDKRDDDRGWPSPSVMAKPTGSPGVRGQVTEVVHLNNLDVPFYAESLRES
jgi:serine/threonine protein kinase